MAPCARRWEQERFYKELKVDARSMPRVRSLTPLTGAQVVVALIVAHTALVDYGIKAAQAGEGGVMRISHLKTLETLRGLLRFFQVISVLLSPEDTRLVARRMLNELAAFAIPKRPQRPCPCAVRRPVSSWPRLRKTTYRRLPVSYTVEHSTTQRSQTALQLAGFPVTRGSGGYMSGT